MELLSFWQRLACEKSEWRWLMKYLEGQGYLAVSVCLRELTPGFKIALQVGMSDFFLSIILGKNE